MNPRKCKKTSKKPMVQHAKTWGWTEREVHILKSYLMKFGIGSWDVIIQSNQLPGKNRRNIIYKTQ